MIAMKKYYDDPLIAAYMAREFGVLVSPKMNTGEINWSCKYPSRGVYTHEWEALPPDWDRYYIHPDSWHIFEPQVGDFITQDGDDFCHKIVSFGANKQPVCSHTSVLYDPYWSDITQRNGKHFFMPKEVSND